MFTGYIYLITNDENGKKYVGQTTKTVSERWAQHRLESRLDRAVSSLYRAIRKYGQDKFSVTTLCKVTAQTKDALKTALDASEIEFIEQYDTYNNGYNMTKGGAVRDHLEIRVAQYSLDGKFIREFNSMLETEEFGFSRPSVGMVCNGKLRSHNGFLWRISDGNPPQTIEVPPLRVSHKPAMNIAMYSSDGKLVDTFKSLLEIRTRYGIVVTTKIVENQNAVRGYRFSMFDDEPLPELNWERKRDPQATAVVQLDKDMHVVAEYKSFSDASRAVGGKGISCISEACRGKRKTAYGYYWKLAQECYERMYI